MSDYEDAAVSAFLDRLRAWLKETHDPRLVVLPNGHERITDVARASADFCSYMAQKAEQSRDN